MKDDSEVSTTQTVELARRFWPLHRSDGGQPCLQMSEAKRRPSIIFDAATAEAFPVGKPGARRDLFRDYLKSGHRIVDVLRWVEDAVGAK